MQQLKIFFIIIILNLCCAHLIYSRPLSVERGLTVGANLQLDMQRAQRQVVQPTWLTDKNRPLLPVDGAVHINQRNLQETAELRDAIQKAVQEGSFAVDVEENQSPQAPLSNTDLNGPPVPLWQSPAPHFGPLPLAPFNPAQWSLPTIGPWLPMDQQQPNAMQRMWSDFIEQTRKLLERN